MTSYIGLVDASSDGAVGIWFPDLPGCTAMADSLDELVPTASTVVRMWMNAAVADGEAPPTARDIAELRQDPDVQEALQNDSASFMEIPLLPKTD